jgi:hypothetical protein
MRNNKKVRKREKEKDESGEGQHMDGLMKIVSDDDMGV